MKVVLSGGGTAGHINPALALAEVLQERGCEVLYAGTPGGVEARLVPEAGIPFTAFEASGFNRSHPLSLGKALRLVVASTGKAKKWFSAIKPDVVACFGGYVCIPVGRAAFSCNVPVVVHEQNSVMGMANAYLAKRSSAVALTYEQAAPAGACAAHVHLTGNPVRRQVARASRAAGRAYCQVPDSARLLTVFGGSLGARHINTAVCALASEILARPDVYVRHITGPKEHDAVCADLATAQVDRTRYQAIPYENRMGDVLAASDLVVSRAGATSLAEISALAVPAILVPFPYATADHQTTNAQAFVARGASLLVPDSQVEGEQFSRALFCVLDDAKARADMRTALQSFGTQHAAEKLADVVCAQVG